jgi:hypothetical protein
VASNAASSAAVPNQQKADFKSTMRGLAYSIIINGVLPYVIYQLLKSYTHTSDFWALVASGVPPLLDALVSVIRKGHIDFLSGFVLLTIVVSVIPVLFGGSARLLLVRESLVTGAFGVAYLVSLLLPRPMMFYFARYFATGNHPENMAWFNGLWQIAGFRHGMRLMTTVWGAGLVVEAAIRIPLAFTLPIAHFLIISPFIGYGFYGGLMVWTMIYSRAMRRRGERLQQEQEVAQQEAARQETA